METIELDCAPGSIRPSDLLPYVLEGTEVQLDPKQPQATFFGCWMWEIPKEQEEKYHSSRDVIAQRIKDLYNLGSIRYGSW
jgi:hypothetical protein